MPKSDQSRKTSSPLRSDSPEVDNPDNPDSCSPTSPDFGTATAFPNDTPEPEDRFPPPARTLATLLPHASPPSQIHFQSVLSPSAPLTPSAHLSEDCRKRFLSDMPPPLYPFGKPSPPPRPPSLPDFFSPPPPPFLKRVLHRAVLGTSPKPSPKTRFPLWLALPHTYGSSHSTRTCPRSPPPPAPVRSVQKAKASPTAGAHFQRSLESPPHTAPSTAGPCPNWTRADATLAGTDFSSKLFQTAGRVKAVPKKSRKPPRSTPSNAPHICDTPLHHAG